MEPEAPSKLAGLLKAVWSLVTTRGRTAKARTVASASAPRPGARHATAPTAPPLAALAVLAHANAQSTRQPTPRAGGTTRLIPTSSTPRRRRWSTSARPSTSPSAGAR